MKDICFPTAPTEKSYTALTNQLKKHLQSKCLAVVEHFCFNTAQQQPGQSISEFMAQLKKLAAHCEHTGDQLKESLRDRFICGLCSESIQKKLLLETYTFECVVEIATAEKAATRDITQHGSRQVNTVKQTSQSHRGAYRGQPWMPHQPKARQPCGRGGLKNHIRGKCWYRDKECFKCGKVGHLKFECRSEKRTGRNPQNVSNPSRTNYVEQTGHPNETEFDTSICRVTEKTPDLAAPKPFTVPIEIEGISLELELDTGVAVSIVSYANYTKYFVTFHCLTQQDTCMCIQAHPHPYKQQERYLSVLSTIHKNTPALGSC